MTKHRSTRRHGSVFVVMLLLLPIIVLFAGFAIDVAYVQRVKTELRSATDLAAKAAAMDLSIYSNLNTARDKAKEIAALNHVGGQPLTLKNDQIVFGNSSRQPDGSYSFVEGGSPNNAVKVVGQRTTGSTEGPIRSFFGTFYGHPEYEPEIESFAAFIDVDICLVLDRSGSMKLPVDSGDSYDPDYHNLPPDPNCRWVALDSAVRQFLTVMDNSFAQEKVGLVTFADSGSKDQDLDFDMSEIEDELDDRLTTIWTGSTDIEDGIKKGKEILDGGEARSTAIQVMVVLTDGNYTEDDPLPEATNAANKDIIIHTITFSDGADQTTMQNIAAIGNGNHYHADTAGDLDLIFQQIAASLAVLIE